MKEVVVHDTLVSTRLTAAQVKKVICSFYQGLGFKNIEDTGNSLLITRGSVWQNKFATNPLKWKSDILVILKETGESTSVATRFTINTINQLVTEPEAQVWVKVFAAHTRLIEAGEAELTSLLEQVKSAMGVQTRILLYTMLGLAISFLPALYLAIEFKNKIFIPLVIGLVTMGFIHLGLKSVSTSKSTSTK